MTSKNNSIVLQMIDKNVSDENMKRVMKLIFRNEVNHSVSSSNATAIQKEKVNNCRGIIEKVVENEINKG